MRVVNVEEVGFISCIGEGTLPWAIFRFRIFSNYTEKIYS